MSEANGSIRGLRKTMVPGRPARVLLCRYYGSEERTREGDLAQGRTVHARRAVGELARSLNRGVVPEGTSMSCPSDTGAVALTFFGYSGGRAVAVATSLDGCQFSTNGPRIVASPVATIERIVALTH